MEPITMLGLGAAAWFGWKEWKKREQKAATREKFRGGSGITWMTEYTWVDTPKGPEQTVYVHFAVPTTGAQPLIIVYKALTKDPGNRTLISKTTDPKYQSLVESAVKDFNIQGVSKAAGAYFTY